MALPVPLSPGDQIYKFTLRDRIGGGFFGEVWLAHDQTVKNDIAVKFLDASRVAIGKLLNEAVVGYRTGHANLVTVHYADVITYLGSPLVAVSTDYYPNGNVLSQVCPGNFVPIQAAVGQIIDILRGLEYLHELDTLHNDIKPQNILVGPKGEGILTDYGISEVTSGAPSTKPVAAYKLHKAPEVIQKNEINAVTDIYQVGMTAFRLINGIGLVRDKFNALGQKEFQARVVVGKLVKPTDYQPFVPNAVKRIINKAIHHDPAQRYQSALEMRRALERLYISGSWLTNGKGEYEGHDDTFEYRYEMGPRKQGRFSFTAFRKRKQSGRETRVGKFSQTGITKQEAEKLKHKFMCDVVEGAL